MTDQIVTLRIQANADGTIRAVRQVAGELDRMGTEGAAGGAAAARGIKQVESESKRAKSSLDGLVQGAKGFAAAFVSLQGAGALARIADEYTNLSSKIRLVTISESELRTVREQVFQVAQATRQDLTATAELYTRLARSTADMGLSQQRLIGITETINQAFVVSGASAQEASAAIIQLSQGLASGVLRGEEFNSVAEQAPIIMDLLAKQLGVTRGELRVMAAEGELTADVLVNALGNGAAGVAEQFANMQLTISGAMTQLRNAFTAFVGQTDEANGASAAFANAISWLAQNLPTVANAAFRLGLAIAAIYSTKVLAAAVAFTGQIVLQTAAHAASTAALIRQQGVMATLFATQSAGFAASLKSIGAINLALGALTAGFAGWQIGTLLREEFLEVRLFGIAMVSGLVNGFERMRQATLIVWESMKFAASAYFNFVRKGAADLVAFFADTAEFTDVFGFNKEAVGRLREIESALRPTKSATIDLALAVARINGETERQIDLNNKVFDEMVEYEIAASLSQEATDSLSDASGELANVLPKVEEAAKQTAASLDDIAGASKAAAENLGRILDRQAEQLGGPAVRAAQDYRDELLALAEAEAALAAAGELSADRIAQIALARSQAAEIYEQQLGEISELDDDFNRAQEQAAQEYERTWLQAADEVSFAIGDVFTGGIRSAKDFARQIGEIVRRMLADMIAQWVRSGVARMFAGLFGGGGSGLALAGNGGGFGQALQLFGGNGGGFGGAGGFGQFANSGFANALPALAAVAGGVYGFSNRGGSNGSAGSVLGGAAYAGLGYTAGTIALGGALGGAAGAATGAGIGATVGGAASGALGAAAAVPVVGWILAIAAAIDAISGGKLFGTRFRPESATSSLSIGEGGGTASASVREVRNRSLFRGRRWRDREIDPGDEAREAAEGLFNQIRDIMVASAQQLQIEVPPIIEGAIRTVSEYDKKGKVTSTKIFVDILGRVWEEATAELAATRLSAEAIIKTVDAAIGSVQTASASAIAERWRGDAEQLLEGAQFLLAAAADVRRGFDLLDGGSLSELTDLVEELATGNEALSQTYARLSASSQLLEQALALSGIELEIAGEAFVRFATDITDAAGGIERAQSLWATYFGTFFSATERAEQQLGQARTFAGRQFEDIGLDANAFAGENGAAMFRALFEEQLPTLSAEAVVEWLEAAEALAGVLAAQQAYNDSLAESIREAEEAAARARAAFEEAVAALTAAFEILVQAIDDTRARIADDIQGLRAGAPGFDEAAFQAGRITDLRAQLDGASAQEQVGLIDQIRDATLARFEAEADQLRRLGSAQEDAARAEAQRYQEATRAAEQAHAEAMRGWEAQIQAAQRLRDFVDGLGLSSVSPLTAFERFDEAQALYQRALQGSDAAAIQQAAQAFLEETRNVYGVSDRAVGIFNDVRGTLGSRADQLASAAAPVFQAPVLEQAIGAAEVAVIDVEAAIEALREQAVADLQGLDDLLAGLRDDAEARFQSELEALEAQYGQAEANTGLIVDAMNALNTDQATRDQAALDVMREQLAAFQAAQEQQAAVGRQMADQQVWLEERLGVIDAGNERIARAIENSARAEVRR